MAAVGTHASQTSGREGPARRLLAVAPDEVLVRRARAGSEAAFAALYERHHRKLLSFCRHMLGSAEEAEDAVQQAFFNALQDMQRHERQLSFRPWLYRIARNLCISALRARRHDRELAETEPSLVGLADQVAERRELRELLRDLARLPVEQREALVLSELHGNSHAEVAEIIGCEREKVKALVFQARSSLLKSREAREVSCEQIRRDLSVLRGGSLRRGIIRRHLSECEGCRRFHGEIKRQRQALALVLPVVPSATLKLGTASAAAAVAAKATTASGTAALAGGAAASGGTAAAGAAGGASAGALASVAAKLGVPLIAVKGAAATAAVTVAAAGGVAGVKATQDVVGRGSPAHERGAESLERPAAVGAGERRSGVTRGRTLGPGDGPGGSKSERAAAAKRRAGGRARERRGSGGPKTPGRAVQLRPGRPNSRHGRRLAPLGASNPHRRGGDEGASPHTRRSRRPARVRGRAPAVERRSARSRRRHARRQELPRGAQRERSVPPQEAELPLVREGETPLSGR